MKTLLIIGAAIVWTLGAYSSGYQTGQSDLQTYHSPADTQAEAPRVFSSVDVWDEVNRYRVDHGAVALTMHDGLCDDMVARYNAIRAHGSHDGFIEFIMHKRDQGTVSSYVDAWELFADGDSAEHTVQRWAGSMGHESALRKGRYGCMYTNGTLSILHLSD